MSMTVGDVIKRVEKRLKGELRNTSEHRGFVTALTGVLEELGAKSPVLEIVGDEYVGDENVVVELDRVQLVEAIGDELKRPAGKIKTAATIADVIGSLLMARGVISRFKPEPAEEPTLKAEESEKEAAA